MPSRLRPTASLMTDVHPMQVRLLHKLNVATTANRTSKVQAWATLSLAVTRAVLRLCWKKTLALHCKVRSIK